MSPRAVQAIGDAALATGFALAGVPTIEAATGSEGVARLASLLDRTDVGIVLADERLIAALPDEVRARVARRATPVLVPVPTPRWDRAPEAAGSYILDLLQRAVGYRVRLQ